MSDEWDEVEDDGLCGDCGENRAMEQGLCWPCLRVAEASAARDDAYERGLWDSR